MEIMAATLASFVDLGADGRVAMINGDLDTLRFQADFPATTVLPVYFYMKFKYPAPESGRAHQCRIELAGPTGDLLMESEQTLDVPASPAGRPVKVGSVMAFAVLTFPAVGEYEFRIIHDGGRVKTLPLYIEQIAANPETLA
jgi:hypothetical protein